MRSADDCSQPLPEPSDYIKVALIVRGPTMFIDLHQECAARGEALQGGMEVALTGSIDAVVMKRSSLVVWRHERMRSGERKWASALQMSYRW